MAENFYFYNIDLRMKESVLNTALHFFAFIASATGEETFDKLLSVFEKYVKSFVSSDRFKNAKVLFIKAYNDFAEEINLFEEPELADNYNSVLLDKVYNESIFQLSLNERILVLMLLVDYDRFMHHGEHVSKSLLENITGRLGFSPAEYSDINCFISGDYNAEGTTSILILKPKSKNKIETLEGSWVDKHLPDELRISRELELENLREKIYMLYLEHLKLFVVRCDKGDTIEINGELISGCKFKILEPGDEIRTKKHRLFNYSEIKQKFLEIKNLNTVHLSVEDVYFRYKRKPKGIRGFITGENSGLLIGIIGNEGTGKSTLLELVAGRITPDSGKIFINGYNLKENKYLLKGIIGYVPEDDLLYDELSVYDNLMLTARFFFSRLSPRELDRKVNQLLQHLGLFEIRHTIVGSIFDKNIQPGQRRLLNISLELIREPRILLVDNAVYSLSTGEASTIIKILNDYTFGGNLVITAISQTSTKAFRMFDKLWILDESGYPIFNGNPGLARDYFSGHLSLPETRGTAEELTPDHLLELVNFRLSDSSGKVGKRKINPSGWHERFELSVMKAEIPASHTKIPLPANFINPPNLETQFKIFSIRNFKVKFSNTYNLVSSILAGPSVALLLGLVLREKTNGTYVFSTNGNIPFFLFLSAIAAIFLGLLISVKEIMRERNNRIKEDYLEFSRFSYINSKISFLFFIALVQTFLYVLTGNAILEIKGMFVQFWLILFSASCFGVMMGLNFSEAHKKITALYETTIPLVLALQILLGGGIIPYNKLNFNDSPYVPVVGELMVSRWAYEALMVEQYIRNDYQKHFYDVEKTISNSSYFSEELIPRLQAFLERSRQNIGKRDTLGYYLPLIRNSIISLYDDYDIFEFEFLNKLNVSGFNKNVASETKDYLTYLEIYFHDKKEKSIASKTALTEKLTNSMGKASLQELKNSSYNNRLASRVLAKSQNIHWKIHNNKICRVSDPVYQDPNSDFGRSVLFVPVKKFRGQTMETRWFNIMIIWLFSFVLYLVILIDVPSYFKA